MSYSDRSHSPSNESGSECRRAIELGRDFEQKKWELAGLLQVIRQSESWRSTGATSLADFLIGQVRISVRTAQELTRVKAKCDELGIAPEKIDELGWSKLAQVASRLNRKNCDQILGDVKQFSVDRLRDKYAKGTNCRPSRRNTALPLTETIQRAVRQAARFTKSNELTVNLEFVCEKFVETFPLAPSRAGLLSDS